MGGTGGRERQVRTEIFGARWSRQGFRAPVSPLRAVDPLSVR